MLLCGGTVVDVDGVRTADVRVVGERIAEVGPPGALGAGGRGEGEEVVPCTGRFVIPGGVDVHTHFHLPVGAVRVSDDFATGTRAAAVGGTTCIVDYVTAYRGQDPLVALATWRRWAEVAAVDYGLHMTFTEVTSEGVVAACVEAGVTSFKLYMAYPDLLQVDDDVILDILLAAKRHGGLVSVHCENGGAIEVLRRRALAEGRTGVLEHARTRPAVLEGEAVTRAVALAEVAETPVYLVHLSSAPALEALRRGQERGVAVYGETCPQYLYLDTSALAGPDGDNFVCTPPLRDPWHVEELWEGLARGTLQCVATDHCPFWVQDRRAGVAGRRAGVAGRRAGVAGRRAEMAGRPAGVASRRASGHAGIGGSTPAGIGGSGPADFTQIPGGLPGVETRMALIWRGVTAGRLGIEDWVRLCCEAPARLFGLWPEKGSLRVGSDADIVVWDPQRHQGLAAADLHMAVDHSPYADTVGEVTGWPELVLARGRVVASGGEPRGEPGWGRYVARRPRPVD